ncbi:MAG: XRE family transcriptional regulator [Duncaniella sp.]|nr:XRE family transcriptional regulator [Duncaniella sp.]
MESIGTLIRQELERQERSVTWLARKLSCDRSNIYRLFQKHSIDTGQLFRISQILGHNFFEDISEGLPTSQKPAEG